MTYQNMDKAQTGGDGGIADGQLDWGEKGGKLWECWVIEPCCDGYCCITWYCCGCFNFCHQWAWSMDQPCSIVNHCLPVACCGACAACSMRYTIRQKAGIKAGGPMNGFVGDALVSYCCAYCAFCQELRASHITGGKQSWDFFGNPKPEVMSKPFKFPPLME